MYVKRVVIDSLSFDAQFALTFCWSLIGGLHQRKESPTILSSKFYNELAVIFFHSLQVKRKENMSEKLAESIEDDNSVTMLDVLQVENQLEEDAYAVLGASDDQNCTYNKVCNPFQLCL